ncbi:hypothetical protein GCM10010182_60850 [Actinomadura cremea]|nr:hypothetical protein GCM10010182_60850 [Actinomadura cremea]
MLLLERARMPRYKTCGGGPIGHAQVAPPDGLKVEVHDTIDSFTFGHVGRGRRTLATSGRRPCRMVFRDELDAALADVAARTGAEVRDGVAPAGLEEDDLVTVRSSTGGAVRTKALIGVGGGASRIARHIGVRYEQTDLALEVEVPVSGRTATGAGAARSSSGVRCPGRSGGCSPRRTSAEQDGSPRGRRLRGSAPRVRPHSPLDGSAMESILPGPGAESIQRIHSMERL